jgi:hypothetical protein
MEQAYLNLGDLFHFLEEGKILEELTNSPFVQKTV